MQTGARNEKLRKLFRQSLDLRLNLYLRIYFGIGQTQPPPPSGGGTISYGCLGRIVQTNVVRSASIWSGFRLGATASWPLSEQWALRTEYRYAQISGRHRGWFHTLHQHDALLGVQYAF